MVETADKEIDGLDPKFNSRLNISGDKLKVGLKNQVDRKEITQTQSDLVWWYFAYAKTNKFDLNFASSELSFSANSTMWRVFTCTYGAKLDGVCAKITRYKKLVEERGTLTRIKFVDTSISKRISRACDAALVSQTIVLIYGDSQIGKTEALLRYASLHNHGQTKYVRMPACGGVQLVAKEIARACFVSANTSFEKLRSMILDAIDDKTLLIVDEVHQAFLSYQTTSQVKVLEFLREIYDRTQCGMVLCGTNVLRTEIQEGKHARLLEQLRRRCTHPIQLPSKPPRPDLDRFAAAFGLSKPDGEVYEIIKDMIHRSGVGMYVKYLQSASRIAKKEGKKIHWKHFVTAHDLFAKLSVQS